MSGSSAVPGAFNLRDLAATPLAQRAVRPGQVFRSDLLHRIDAQAAHNWLADRTVGLVVDLRTEGERDADGFLATDGSFAVAHVPLMDEVWSWEDERDHDGESFLRDRTIEIFERHPDRIVSVLDLIAEADGPTLFHCTAGKDRTGVVACVLLGVIGAPNETIIADYSASALAMPALMGYYRDLHAQTRGGDAVAEFDEQKAAVLLERAATPFTMSSVLDHLASSEGSLLQWATSRGLADSAVSVLRQRLQQSTQNEGQ
jgi:protein-tyrosine phosphatase